MPPWYYLFFNRNISTVGVSAATGEGITELLTNITLSRKEFQEIYVPELVARAENRVKLEKIRQRKEVERLKKDISQTRGDRPIKLDDSEYEEEEEEQEEEEEEEEDTF